VFLALMSVLVVMVFVVVLMATAMTTVSKDAVSLTHAPVLF
jgi:hypothetical protein